LPLALCSRTSGNACGRRRWLPSGGARARRPPRPPSVVGDGGVRLRPSCGNRLDDAAIKSLPSGVGDGGARLRPAGEAEEVCADDLALVVDVATDEEVRTAHQFACLVVVDTRHSGPAAAQRTSDEKPAARRPRRGRATRSRWCGAPTRSRRRR
ncbi:Os01g0694800, partial [Oryza sativa Japonica Group]